MQQTQKRFTSYTINLRVSKYPPNPSPYDILVETHGQLLGTHLKLCHYFHRSQTRFPAGSQDRPEIQIGAQRYVLQSHVSAVWMHIGLSACFRLYTLSPPPPRSLALPLCAAHEHLTSCVRRPPTDSNNISGGSAWLQYCHQSLMQSLLLTVAPTCTLNRTKFLLNAPFFGLTKWPRLSHPDTNPGATIERPLSIRLRAQIGGHPI